MIRLLVLANSRPEPQASRPFGGNGLSRGYSWAIRPSKDRAAARQSQGPFPSTTPMPKAKRMCYLETTLDADSLRSIMQVSDFNTLAQLSLASAQIAGQVAIDLHALACENPYPWRGFGRLIRALAVRLSPQDFAALISASLDTAGDEILDLLLDNADAIGMAASTCRDRDEWTPELILQMIKPWLTAYGFEAQIASFGYADQSTHEYDELGLSAFTVRHLTDKIEAVTKPSLLRAIMERFPSLTLCGKALAWFLLNSFGDFLDECDFGVHDAMRLGLASAELQLTGGQMAEVIAMLREEERFIGESGDGYPGWALATLVAWVDNMECCDESARQVIMTQALHIFAGLSGSFSESGANKLDTNGRELWRSVGSAFGRFGLFDVPTGGELLRRIWAAEQELERNVQIRIQTHIHWRLANVAALKNASLQTNASALFLESWAEGASFPASFSSSECMPVFDLIARQSDKFQRDISRSLVGWLGELVARGADAATIASGCACVAVRPDLYGVPQVQLESHPIVVRRDRRLRSGMVLSFTLNGELAVATLRVRLTDGDGSDGTAGASAMEITIDADNDAWVWPGHEDELAPPLKGTPQSELVGSRISLICVPSELQGACLPPSTEMTIPRASPKHITFGDARTDTAPVHAGTVTRFECDAKCKIKWLRVAVSTGGGTGTDEEHEEEEAADQVEVKVHPKSSLWCWDGCEANKLVKPLHGVQMNDLVGHIIFLSFNPGTVVESEVVSVQLSKNPSAGAYSVDLIWVAVTWGAAHDRHGSLCISPYGDVKATGIDWRWPGYEHEMLT